MKRFSIVLLLLGAVVLSVLNGCADSAPSGPTPGLGGATVTKYVAIGNSLTAGYQSNGLYASAQQYSYPNLIAQQLTASGSTITTFQQPLYSDPGTPDASGKASRYEILGWSASGPIIGPAGSLPGAPTNSALARPYDNLGIPGIPILGFLDTTGSYNGNSGPTSIGQLVLRTLGGLPKSVFGQVKMLQPDFVTFWLGANDVLGFAASGGASPSAPTPTVFFTGFYNAALDSLRAALPTAKIAVGNIPNVTSIPFFNTAGPLVAATLPGGLYLRYQRHGNTSLAFDSTRFAEANAPLLCLTAVAYETVLGLPSGKWYKDHGYPPPAGIDTTKPFGFHPQNPIPDALVLDDAEQATAAAAVAAFNGIIATEAAKINAALVDFNGFFTNVHANGLNIGGTTFTTEYVAGGLFSLDGVHPSSRGYGIVANEWLKAINAKFGMSLPFVNVAAIPGISAPLFKAGKHGMPTILPGTFDHFSSMFRQSVE